MPITYQVETKSFKHQRINPNNIDSSGNQVEAEPDPDADIQTYLNAKGADDWELVEMITVRSSSASYQYTFVFKK